MKDRERTGRHRLGALTVLGWIVLALLDFTVLTLLGQPTGQAIFAAAVTATGITVIALWMRRRH